MKQSWTQFRSKSVSNYRTSNGESFDANVEMDRIAFRTHANWQWWKMMQVWRLGCMKTICHCRFTVDLSITLGKKRIQGTKECEKSPCPGMQLVLDGIHGSHFCELFWIHWHAPSKASPRNHWLKPIWTSTSEFGTPTLSPKDIISWMSCESGGGQTCEIHLKGTRTGWEVLQSQKLSVSSL